MASWIISSLLTSAFGQTSKNPADNYDPLQLEQDTNDTIRNCSKAISNDSGSESSHSSTGMPGGYSPSVYTAETYLPHSIDNPESLDGSIAEQRNANELVPSNPANDQPQDAAQYGPRSKCGTLNSKSSDSQLLQQHSENGATDPSLSRISSNINDCTQPAIEGVDPPPSNDPAAGNDTMLACSVSGPNNKEHGTSEETYELTGDDDRVVNSSGTNAQLPDGKNGSMDAWVNIPSPNDKVASKDTRSEGSATDLDNNEAEVHTAVPVIISSLIGVQISEGSDEPNRAAHDDNIPDNSETNAQLPGDENGTMDSMNADHVNRKDTRSAGSVVDPNTVEQSEETDKLKKVTDADVTPVIGNSPGSAAHLNGTTESRNEVCGASSMVTGQGQLLDEDKEDNSLDRLLHDDVIIAIMGPTGSGKSSFISRVTGNADGIGHTLTSCTSEVKVTKVEKLANVVLVDTPGFDDTNKSDLEILELISKWLNKTYRNKVYLSAIFYFHRITDNRMAGTPLKNLRVFKKLCGNNAMAQVFLVTTMWDEVEEDVGVERLNELKSTYWKGMVSRGSTVVEYRNTWDSATKLLDDATRRSSERRHVTLQKEISELKMELRETEAGQQLCSRLEDLADQRLQTLRKLREEQSKSGDPRSTEELRKEYTELRAQLDDTLKQVHALRLPLRKRAAAQLRKIFSHPRRK